MDYIIITVISLLSSIVGSLCGIGGGVIIKPVIDALGLMRVSTASLLSGLTVLGMSCYTITLLFVRREASIVPKTAIPLCLGGMIGGLLGKQLFTIASDGLGGGDQIGALQAGCLFLLVCGTMVYTLCKRRIQPLHIEHPIATCLAGLLLGILSSFLGIGGGPFNLIVLSYLFSMSTKVSAQNSLLVILCSQVTSLMQSIITATVPPFSWFILLLMVSMGVSGAVIGRQINKAISDGTVDRLFLGLNTVILLICIYNFFLYLAT